MRRRGREGENEGDREGGEEGTRRVKAARETPGSRGEKIASEGTPN